MYVVGKGRTTDVTGNIRTLLATLSAGIAKSVQRLAKSLTVQGSNPGEGEIFRTRPDSPWGPIWPPIPWLLGLS